MKELCYVEDDIVIANVVKEYFEHKNFSVTICTTLMEAKKVMEVHVPSIVLLDWNMPDGNGDSLCRWIRNRWKAIPIVFLTVRSDSSDVVSGFQNGADDYVVKPFELVVLYSRIMALLRRTSNVSEQYISCNGIIVDQQRRTVSCNSIDINLSVSEYELLIFLMRNKGKTVTREKILEQVWDVNGSFVNDNTLTVTMKRLRDKLNQPSCLKTVRSVGYRMEDTI